MAQRKKVETPVAEENKPLTQAQIEAEYLATLSKSERKACMRRKRKAGLALWIQRNWLPILLVCAIVFMACSVSIGLLLQ